MGEQQLTALPSDANVKKEKEAQHLFGWKRKERNLHYEKTGFIITVYTALVACLLERKSLNNESAK